MTKWHEGDIVQIDPDHDKMFGGKLMIVTEPKDWGAQGYFIDIATDQLAFYRVNHDHAEMCGHVKWMIRDEIS